MANRSDITDDVRAEALELIRRHHELAADVYSLARLSDPKDALYTLIPRILLVNSVFAIAGVGLVAAFTSLALVVAGLPVFITILLSATTLVLKDRDERRALSEKASKLLGLVDGEGELNVLGLATAEEYEMLLTGVTRDPILPTDKLVDEGACKRLKALGRTPLALPPSKP